MTNLYLNTPLNTFLFSLPTGIIIGVLFDIFRFIRKIGFNSYKHTLFQDILFSILASVIIFLFTFCINGGVYRSYMFIGVALSFYIYYNTLGYIFIHITDTLISIIRRFISFLYNNIIIRLYISLDKFYKKGKINIEKNFKRRYEKKIFIIMKG